MLFEQDMLWSGLRHFKLDVEKVIEASSSTRKMYSEFFLSLFSCCCCFIKYRCENGANWKCI